MSEQSFQLSGQSVEEWEKVAQAVVEHLHAPLILALSGPLGAGKTTFVQALANLLGVVDRPRSPTFSLLCAYVLPVPQNGIRRLVHIDAYRLEKASDVYALDLETELAEPGTIVAIEWPEQLGEALQNFGARILNINIQPSETGVRVVSVKS